MIKILGSFNISLKTLSLNPGHRLSCA